ncbi:MAG: gfo/Idh/MocA family oxidoreductase [Planctomycetota bacterium]|nr:MAG: gfo/Idh/MocA family oxidoreductase [Planctomycetota bacterium]
MYYWLAYYGDCLWFIRTKEGCMKDVIRWGIIGCGNVCERKSGPPLYELTQCRLQAVTRRDTAKGRDFAQRHGPCIYEPSIEALLARDDLDAIYVASPDAQHHAHTLEAAASGRHVLVEKAMASNTAECNEMITACESAGVLLSVAYYRRCYPSILAAKELLDQGLLGEVKELWINDQFPTSHRIDLAHFLLGDVAQLRVTEGRLPPDSHAASGQILETQHLGGARCTMNSEWRENHDIEKLVIDGSEARLVIDDLKAGRMWLVKGWSAEPRHQSPLPWTHQGLMAAVSDHFLGRGPNPCSGEEGRKSTVILDSIAQAAADPGDQWRQVDYRRASSSDQRS